MGQDHTVMLEIDKEDYEFLQNQLDELEEKRDKIENLLVGVWKNKGRPRPEKTPDIPFVQEHNYDACDDAINAMRWIRHGEEVPPTARRYFGFYNRISGQIKEICTQVHIIKQSYEEKVFDN